MKIVYADITGDLFHRGHVEFFKKAKSLFNDTYLIIGINRDEDVKKYKRQPFTSMDDRVEIFKYCRLIDKVISDVPFFITECFLNEHKIDVVLHGDDMTDYLKENNYAVPIKLGKMVTIPYYKGTSTTEIIERIINEKR